MPSPCPPATIPKPLHHSALISSSSWFHLQCQGGDPSILSGAAYSWGGPLQHVCDTRCWCCGSSACARVGLNRAAWTPKTAHHNKNKCNLMFICCLKWRIVWSVQASSQWRTWEGKGGKCPGRWAWGGDDAHTPTSVPFASFVSLQAAPLADDWRKLGVNFLWPLDELVPCYKMPSSSDCPLQQCKATGREQPRNTARHLEETFVLLEVELAPGRSQCRFQKVIGVMRWYHCNSFWGGVGVANWAFAPGLPLQVLSSHRLKALMSSVPKIWSSCHVCNAGTTSIPPTPLLSKH